MHESQGASIEMLLSHVPLFSGLGPEELARIARGSREVHAAKRDVLFRKGDPCDGFHLIVSGRVKLVFSSAEGVDKVVEILDRGQTLGDASLFDERVHDLTAEALSDALLIHVSKAVLFAEFDRDPGLRLKMLAGMSRRLRQVMDDVESYSLHSGKQRVINYFLLTLSRNAPARDAVLLLPTSKANIASRLNLTQEHFSRILRELSSAGLISVQGGRITIPDVPRLKGGADSGA